MNPTLEKLNIPDYEEVYKISEPTSGLLGIIAIHSTKNGPALGGVRAFPYQTFDKALEDALRLSRGMTIKCFLGGTSLGGGKSVIIADPKKGISTEVWRAFGQCVEKLEGRYYTAEDSGSTQKDLQVIAQETSYIVGLESDESSGNPCPYTAWGTLRGIQATIEEITGSSSLEGKTIAIQGLGFVGSILAELLFWHGANLIVTDIDAKKLKQIVRKFDATPVEPDHIYDVPCDIFAPCAMGGTLNENTIARLKCYGVAGCANNQLLTPEDGERLNERGILYAPDVLVNAGGVINVQTEIGSHTYRPTFSRDHVNQIFQRTKNLFALAKEQGISPQKALNYLLQQESTLQTAQT